MSRKNKKEYIVEVTGIVAHFSFEDFDTLNMIRFLNKDFLIPYDVEKYLECNYGVDWKIPSNKENWNSRTPINNYKKITYTYIISE